MDKVHIIHFRAIILACGCFGGFVDDFRWGSKMAFTWVKALNCEIESTVILNCHYESRTSIQRGENKNQTFNIYSVRIVYNVHYT